MEKIFLDQYDGQSVGELIAMQDTHRIDSLLLAIEMGIEQTLTGRERADLSVPELTVLAVEALEREVNNGGYHQFFLNSSVEYVHDIVPALERIGCTSCAAITAGAIAILRLPESADPEEIPDLTRELEDEALDELGKCDSRYFANRESIGDALFAYVERHASEIPLP